jgi:hypothetical protein
METRLASLTETLTEERIRKVGEKIAGLPDGGEFEEKVKDDLWQKFVGDDNPKDDEPVEWDDLPDESKSVIGYVDEDETEVPWWLESFEWEAHTYAGTTISISDSLSTFSNASVRSISKPKLREAGLSQTLDSFKELQEAIDGRVERSAGNPEYSLPDTNLFEITQNSIEVTDEFGQWLEEKFLHLCPPFNEELTALLMVSSNVKRDFLEVTTPDTVMETLDSLGFSGERIFESEYHSPLVDILRNMGDFFHVSLPSDNLETLFYESWVESYEGNMDNWIEKAITTNEFKVNKPAGGDIGSVEEEKFAQVAFNLPLRRGTNRSRLIYTTCELNSDGYYSSRFEDVEAIMKSAVQ